jgi:hypothetical protein
MAHIPGGFVGSMQSEFRVMPLWKIKKYFPNEYEKEKRRRAKSVASKKGKKSKTNKKSRKG